VEPEPEPEPVVFNHANLTWEPHASAAFNNGPLAPPQV